MKCARCGADASKASWFCDSCGSRLGEVNLALTIGSPPARRRERRWLGLAALALVAVLGLAAFAQRSALRSGVATVTSVIRSDAGLSSSVPVLDLLPWGRGEGSENVGAPSADGDRPEWSDGADPATAELKAADTEVAPTTDAVPALVTPTVAAATNARNAGRVGSTVNTQASDAASGSAAGDGSGANEDTSAGTASGGGPAGSSSPVPTAPRSNAARAPGQGPVPERGSNSHPVGTARAPAPTAAGRGDSRLLPSEAALTPTAVSGRVRPNAPVWVAGPNPAFVLDGWLDDWHYDGQPVNQRVFGEEHWDGPADLSAQAFVAWSSEGLLFGARVIDDVVSVPATGADLHLGDGLELQIDTELLSDWGGTTYDADDWQIGLSPGDLESRPPEAYVWRPEGVDPTGIRLEAQRTNDGYILEGVIPWRLLGLTATDVDRLGFSFNISDNDLPEPAQLTMLASAPGRSWSDPTSFGTLLIER